VELAAIDVRQHIAHAQAEVMAQGDAAAPRSTSWAATAKFFDRFVKAVTLGQSIDGAVEGSDTIRAGAARRTT
jgi:hypothetical protein